MCALVNKKNVVIAEMSEKERGARDTRTWSGPSVRFSLPPDILEKLCTGCLLVPDLEVEMGGGISFSQS